MGKLALYTSTMHKCIENYLGSCPPGRKILHTDTIGIFIKPSQQFGDFRAQLVNGHRRAILSLPVFSRSDLSVRPVAEL